VHWVTVARWKRNGWKSNGNDDHPLDVARAKLEAIAALATGDPIPAAAKERDEQPSDPALLRQEARHLSALSLQVWNAAEPQLAKLVRRRTGELALLIEALAVSSQAAMNALSQAEKMENGHDAGRDRLLITSSRASLLLHAHPFAERVTGIGDRKIVGRCAKYTCRTVLHLGRHPVTRSAR